MQGPRPPAREGIDLGALSPSRFLSHTLSAPPSHVLHRGVVRRARTGGCQHGEAEAVICLPRSCVIRGEGLAFSGSS